MRFWEIPVEEHLLDEWAAAWRYEGDLTLVHVDGLRLYFDPPVQYDPDDRRTWSPDFVDGSVQVYIDVLLARGVKQEDIYRDRMVMELTKQGRLLFIHRPPGARNAPHRSGHGG